MQNTVLLAINKHLKLMLNSEDDVKLENYIDYRGVGLNSVQLLTLMIKLEEEFDFEFDDDLLILEDFKLVSDIVICVSTIVERESV